MFKRMFATIVSVAMLFCMSTSAMGVHAEDSVSFSIEGAENDTITLYYRSDDPSSQKGNDLNVITDLEINFENTRVSVLSGKDVVSAGLGHITSTWNPEGSYYVWFDIKQAGVADISVQLSNGDEKKFNVNVIDGDYITRFDNTHKDVLALVGETIDLKQHVYNHSLPENAVFADENLSFEVDDYEQMTVLDDGMLKINGECDAYVTVNTKRGNSMTFRVVGIEEPVSSISFYSNINYKVFDETKENEVRLNYRTNPKAALDVLDVSEVEVSVSDTSIAEVGLHLQGSLGIEFYKPGTVEVTIKYKGFIGKTTVTCYIPQNPEVIESQDTVTGYVGYSSRIEYTFGEKSEEMKPDVTFNILDGENIISLGKDAGSDGGCSYIAKTVGTAVVRIQSVYNEKAYKDVTINVVDEEAPEPDVRLFSGEEWFPLTKECSIKNETVTVEYGNNINFIYEYGYYAQDVTGTYITNLKEKISSSKILESRDTISTYSASGDGLGNYEFLPGNYGLMFATFKAVKPGSEKIEVLPGKYLTVNVVLQKENVAEDTPVIENTTGNKVGINSDALSTSQSNLTAEVSKVVDSGNIDDVVNEIVKDHTVVNGEVIEYSIFLNTKVTQDSESKDLVFDITPMVKVVSDLGGTKTAIGEPKKFDVTEPVTITLPVGDYFNGESPETVYVIHVKEDGTKYVYTASYDFEAKTVTFENPHGFSTFSISSTAPEGYYVNSTYYATAAEALAALPNNGTLTVTTNADITVDKAITFTLVTAEGKTVRILTTDEFEATNQGNVYTVKTKTPSTPGTGNEGGSGSNPNPGEGNNGGSGTMITPPSNETNNNGSSSTTENRNPVVDTSDTTNVLLYGSVGFISVLGVIVLVIFRKKHA